MSFDHPNTFWAHQGHTTDECRCLKKYLLFLKCEYSKKNHDLSQCGHWFIWTSYKALHNSCFFPHLKHVVRSLSWSFPTSCGLNLCLSTPWGLSQYWNGQGIITSFLHPDSMARIWRSRGVTTLFDLSSPRHPSPSFSQVVPAHLDRYPDECPDPPYPHSSSLLKAGCCHGDPAL